MPRKRKTSFLEDVITIASALPWWACLLLAAVSYAGLHMLAGMRVIPSTPTAGIISGLMLGLSIGGQFVAPIVFLIAAGVSAFKQVQRKRLERHGASTTRDDSKPESGHIGASSS